jgi:predicted ATPase
MKIALAGCGNSGKSTLLQAFLRRWPMYKTPTTTYRDLIASEGIQHSSKTSDETQALILDWMLKEQDKYDKDDMVIYDRCPWDCLAYTLQANEADLVSDETAAAIIDIVKNSLKHIDIIFWLRHDPSIRIVDDGMRDTDLDFIKKSDQIFADLYHQYAEGLEKSPFYIADNAPAIVEVIGSTIDDRIAWIGEFLNERGELIETEKSILDPENVQMLERMLKDQGIQIEKDNEFKKLTQQINSFKL